MEGDGGNSEQVKLTPAAIVAMYGGSLYDIPEAAGAVGTGVTKKAAKKENIADPTGLKGNTSGFNPARVLGEFKSGLLVLIDNPEEEFLDDSNQDFLGKILAAFKLDLQHIAMINLAHNFAEYDVLKQNFVPSSILYFGLEQSKSGLPMHFPQFQVQTWDNCKFLFVPSLQSMNGDTRDHRTIKRRLLTALQNFFA